MYALDFLDQASRLSTATIWMLSLSVAVVLAANTDNAWTAAQ